MGSTASLPPLPYSDCDWPRTTPFMRRRLHPMDEFERPTRVVGTLLALPLHHQPVPPRPVAGAGAPLRRDTGDRRGQRGRALLLVEARGVRHARTVGTVRDAGAQRVERIDGRPGLRHRRHREVRRRNGIQTDGVVPLLTGPDGVEILPGYEHGRPRTRRRAHDPLAPEPVAVRGELGRPLQLPGQRGGVRRVVVAAVARRRDAFELLAGRALHLEADGVDPQPGPLPGQLLGDLAGPRRTAVVLAVGDQQDRARTDDPSRGSWEVLKGPAEGQPDRSVTPGLHGRHGPLHGRPVEPADRLYEPGVRAAPGAVGAVHPQPGRIPLGEVVDDGADGRTGTLHPGAPRTVVVRHGAGRVEHHDQAAARTGARLPRSAGRGRRDRHRPRHQGEQRPADPCPRNRSAAAVVVCPHACPPTEKPDPFAPATY